MNEIASLFAWWNWWDWVTLLAAILVTCYMALARNPHAKATNEHDSLRLARIGVCLALWSVGFGLVGMALTLAASVLALIAIFKGRTIYGGVALILAIAVFSIGWFNLSPKIRDFSRHETKAPLQAVPAPSPVSTNIINFKPFMVDLSGASRTRFLKMGICVFPRDEALMKTLKANLSSIRNEVFLLLTKKTYAQIASVEGKEKLRKEMMNIINSQILGKGRVKQLFFTELVVH
jgi:flagellar basal body-associated protein FliL